MIRIQGSVSKGWLNQEGGFVFGRPYYFQPRKRHLQDREMNLFVQKRFGRYSVYNMESNLGQAEHMNDGQVLVGGIQPNLILAAMLGAGFVFYPDKDMDVKGQPLSGLQDVRKLPDKEALLKHELVQLFSQQVLELKEQKGVRPIPPFFWDTSGRATIHGIITTSFKLAGQDIYLDMMAQPGRVKDIHRWVTESYVALAQYFANLADIEVCSVHLGECNGTMLSCSQYEEFVLPYAEQLGQELGPLRVHSCGQSDHLLDSLKKLSQMNVIDTGSGTSVRKIRQRMGQSFEIHYAPPVELLMPGTGKAQVRAWYSGLEKENQDGPLQLSYHLEPGYAEDNCLELHRLIEG